MRLAFSKPSGLGELAATFRTEGYAGLQLKGGQYAAYVEAPERFTAEWGADPAVTSALITMGGLDVDGIAALRRLTAFAAEVRAERIVFCHAHSRDGLTDGDIAGFAGVLTDIGAEAAASGVALSLHHHYQQPVMHRRDFDTFFAAASGVGLTVDTAHLVKSGVTDVAGLIRDFGGVLDNVHAKDFAAGEFRILGQGDMDFDPIFAALRDIGYAGWLCVDEESDATLADGLRLSREFLDGRL